MTSARDYMSKADTVTIAAIEAGVPTLVAARTLTDRFHAMIRNRKEADLVPWIAAASDSLIGSFASGVTKDIAAVHAALVQPWSNGQTEGQITKLKLVKRQMYGRAKIDLPLRGCHVPVDPGLRMVRQRCLPWITPAVCRAVYRRQCAMLCADR